MTKPLHLLLVCAVILLSLVSISLSAPAVNGDQAELEQLHTAMKPLLEKWSRNGGSFNGVKGDGNGVCVACTMGIKILENLALHKEKSIEEALKKICDYFPSQIQTACQIFVTIYGPKLIEYIKDKNRPDLICQKLNICKNSQCILFPRTASQMNSTTTTSSPSSTANSSKVETVRQSLRMRVDLKGWLDKLESWWKELFRRIYEVFNDHIPLFDSDKDGFATSFAFRGSAWRGRDCNDKRSDVYPGRRLNAQGNHEDHNCNGIHGTAPSGRSWEEELCGDMPNKGIAVLGDSAAAHFRIPEQWLLPEHFTKETFMPMLQIAENEADWPHRSFYTGYLNDTTGLSPGIVDSIYLRMLKRNRCIHRDYQNIAVNGARTSAMKTISKTLSRNQAQDNPLLVFYALVGNDICSPHHSLDRFTKPQDFYNNVVATLEHLDTTLAPNSTVVFVGIADGGMLYEILHDKMHPMGTTYAAVYDYLNCLEMNPCWGWMNTNATVRNIATKHASLLNEQYEKIIAEKRFRNFDMHYQDFPIKEMLDRYPNLDRSKIIEPVDGFHPSYYAQKYLAQVLWDGLMAKAPHIFGPVNPNNEKIVQLFGDQGGY